MGRPCLVATMPRSGTVYHRYLLATYDGLLKGATGVTPPIFGGNFDGKIGPDIDLAVCHAIFPGFREEYRGAHRATWDALEFRLAGYDGGSRSIDAEPDRWWPSRNPEVRIVYIVREQFAQMSSYWRHCRNHIDAAHREAAALGEVEFIRRVAMEGYFKQKFTWDEMAWRYPKQVMRLTYEGIMYEREKSLRRMLAFFGHHADADTVLEAISLTSAGNLAAYERETGRSLVPDQVGRGQTHFSSPPSA